jgi:hypothetical protein
MIHKRAVLFLYVGLLLAAESSFAQKPGALGDPAPPITVLEWVKGRPAKIQPGTNFFVLIFCPLSQASDVAIGNFSALQKKYQDQGLVEIIISEEAPPTVQDFIRTRGADINFTVAADDYAGRTRRSYQLPFHQSRLPQAFVVSRDAKILWFGHPLSDELGSVVEQVAGNRFDLEQATKTMLTRDQLQEYTALARINDPQAAKAGQVLFGLWTNDAPALCNLAFRFASDAAMGNRDTAFATAVLNRAAQISDTNASDIAVTRAILLFQTGHEQDGLSAAKNALAAAQTDTDRRFISNNIHAMEKRLMLAATNQTSAASGNPAGTTNRQANP